MKTNYEVLNKLSKIIKDNRLNDFDILINSNNKENIIKDAYSLVINYKNLDFLELLLKNYFSNEYIGIEFINLAQYFQEKSYIANIVKLFIDHGYKINTVIKKEYTPLILGVLHNNLDFINLVIENGADINYTNEIGQTPLMIAVKKHSFYESVNILIDKSDLSKIDQEGNSYIHIACRKINNKNFEIRKNIIEKTIGCGISINYQNLKGEAPLHILCEGVIKTYSKYQIYIIKLLLDSGASISIPTRRDVQIKRYLFPKGSTPFDIIKTKNARVIEKILLNH